MDNCNPNFPCCPPETAKVVQVQSVAGIKGLNNCFVYVQSINTSFYVDNAHRITWISAGVVEEENYNLQTNPLNLRNQFLYDPNTQEVHYFSNTGYEATFTTSITKEELEELEQKVLANTQDIATNSSNIAQNTSDIQKNINDIATNAEAIAENKTAIANEAIAREQSDNNLQSIIDRNFIILNEDLKDLEQTSVQRDTTISSDESTVTLTKTIGILEDEGEATEIPLPVASETSAGVMNSATYQAIQNNSENVDAILNGAVALENLSATSTQEELTDAWKEATGKTTLINRASIYDITNDKVWYYYENIDEWKPLTATGSEVSISTFTNETAGIIKGSENDGQLFAEADGTGSVVGWDTVKADIVNLNNELDGLEIPKLPASMVYDFVSPAGTNNPSTADNANITVRVVNTSTGATSNSVLMMPMASSTQAGSVTASNKSKLDALPAITEIGENLELTDEGVLNATGGGGSDVNLLTAYNASPGEGDVYNASYVNGRLNAQGLAIGANATVNYTIPRNNRISIGPNTRCSADNSVVVGANAYTLNSGNNQVVLGYGATTTRSNEVSIGSEDKTSPGSKTRYLANVTAGERDNDAVNVKQLRTQTIGEVLYASPNNSATITLSSPVSAYEKVEVIANWTLPYQSTPTPLQVITFWHLNDQDNSRVFQLRASDVDIVNQERTEVTDTWVFTNSTTIDLLSSTQIAGPLADSMIDSSDEPYITITKVIGYKAI